MQRPMVDLPEPLSPTRPRVWPLGMERETPSTAWTAPIWRWMMMPWVMGKCITRSSMRRKLSLVMVGAVAGAGIAIALSSSVDAASPGGRRALLEGVSAIGRVGLRGLLRLRLADEAAADGPQRDEAALHGALLLLRVRHIYPAGGDVAGADVHVGRVFLALL